MDGKGRPPSPNGAILMKVNELKALRAGKIDAMETLNLEMSAEDYEEDPVKTQAYDELKVEVTGLDKKIKQTEEVEALKATLAKPVEGQRAATGALRVPAQARTRFTKLKAYKGEDAAEKAYRVGKWVQGFIVGDEVARAWCRENGVMVERAMGETTNTAGGFLVPNEMMDSIIDLRETFGVFRQNAQLVPMSSDTLQWPRRTGGLTAYFTAENTAATESQGSWDNVNLVAKKLAVLTRLSTELSEDAVVSVADLMTSEIAYAFASKEDDCGFNGDGTSTYGGIRGVTQILIDGSHNAGKATCASGHPTFDKVDATDIGTLMSKLPQYALGRAKFYTSAKGFALTFERLVASAGGNSISTLDGAVQYRYLGFPIVISQKIADLANAVVGILFGDLALAAALGERRVVTIRRSDDRYFENDQIGILGTERTDIVVHDVGDNTTAGPIVGLAGTT
jgi:HK97 family phage major capsid protein